MKIVDFCTDYDSVIWEKTLENIVNGDDELKNNYINLTPRDFVCWPVLIDNNEIVCFSGLQINYSRWSDKFARINSRFYISPKYRHHGPGKLHNDDKFLNTKYLLPIQIQQAKKLNFSGVFMSREGDHRRVFELYVELAGRNTGYEFDVLPDRYNVCGHMSTIPDSCKQWIALHNFNNDSREWNTIMNEFKILS